MAASPDGHDPKNRISDVVSYRPVGEPEASKSWPEDPQSNPALNALGMWLFIAALFMLFAAMIFGYLYIRIGGSNSPELHTVHFPKLLYLSTFAVLVVSAAMHLSVKELRAAHYRKFREWLLVSLVASLGFVLVQVPAMFLLMRSHHQAEQQGFYLYGLIFFLILTHALHVVGGLAALVWTFYWGYAGYYTEDTYLPVRNTALYWHFLDVIWVCMFLMFLITG